MQIQFKYTVIVIFAGITVLPRKTVNVKIRKLYN